MIPRVSSASAPTPAPPRFIPPHLLLATAVVMVALDRLMPLVSWDSAGRWPGAIVALAGLALIFSAHGEFTKAGTPVRPFSETTAVVTDGPYRFTRNPMYLGMVIILVGFGVFLGSAGPFLAIPAFAWMIQSRFIQREEAVMEARFGEAYLELKRRVPRWLVR